MGDTRSLVPPMELRVYLLRSDARGGAIELGRLEHCSSPIPPQEEKAPLQGPALDRASAPAEKASLEGPALDRASAPAEKAPLQGSALDRASVPAEKAPLQGPALDRSSVPAPAWSSEDEAAPAHNLHLAVLVGCEVVKVGRLSSFLEGWSSTEKTEEATGEGEEKERETGEGEEADSLSQEEEKVEGGVSEMSSSEEDQDLEEQVEAEDASDTSSESMCGGGKAQYCLQIRLWPDAAYLVLILFEWDCWKLTKRYRIKWLDHHKEEVTKMLGLETETTQHESSGSKGFSNWARSCNSWFDFKGSLGSFVEELIFAEFSPTMSDFNVKEVLGEGASGNVYLCSYKNAADTKFEYALKKMTITKDDDIDATNYMEPREVNIMSCLFNEQVVRFYQAWVANEGEEENINDYGYASEDSVPEFVYIVIQMERCFRTLRDDIPWAAREIDREESWMVFEEVTKAVQLVHHKGVIHRDLKPENFLFGSNGRVKVGDFGHACWARSKISDLKGTPERGTQLYMAPELDEGPVTYKVDSYSLGVIYVDLFHPFSSMQEEIKVLERMREDEYPTDWKGESSFHKKLIATCPSARLSTDEILEYIAERRQMTPGNQPLAGTSDES